MVKSQPPASVNVTLFGNRAFTNDRVRMRSLGYTLTQYKIGVLIKRRNLNADTHKWSLGPETTPPISLRPSEAREEVWNRFSSRAARRNQSCCTSTSSLQDCKTVYFCCLSHPICGNLLWQPQESNTPSSSYYKLCIFKRNFNLKTKGWVT